MKHKNPETISVMLVDITVNGERAKMSQKIEDETSKLTGYRIRITQKTRHPA